jgi:hypothetical protein
MTIARLKLDESAKLEFGVSITGTSNNPEMRFVIEGKGFSISYPCKNTNTGIEVEIFGLKNILSAGEYPVKLEAILDNKLYIPMKETIAFEPGIEILTLPQVNQVKESIEVNNVIIKVQEKHKNEIVEEYMEEILEARGRPRKPDGPTARKKAKEAALKSDDDDDYGPDVGPEADQNIIVHLKKTMDNEKHETSFSDGSKHVVAQHVAKHVHDSILRLKPEQRKQVQDHIQKSHKNLMDVYTMMQGK